VGIHLSWFSNGTAIRRRRTTTIAATACPTVPTTACPTIIATACPTIAPTVDIATCAASIATSSARRRPATPVEIVSTARSTGCQRKPNNQRREQRVPLKDINPKKIVTHSAEYTPPDATTEDECGAMVLHIMIVSRSHKSPPAFA
jgi:hypothetical protein